jgi:putative oxidoreductase
MRTFIQRITATQPSVAPLILRIAFALVLWAHGAQLLLGWFGGYGYTGSMNYFTTQAGLPSFIAFLVIFIQFFGSLLILLGLFTRVVAFAAIILFLGMIITVHQHYGFFMNWYGNAKGEGYEYHLFGIGILLALLLAGGGKASVDAVIAKNNSK